MLPSTSLYSPAQWSCLQVSPHALPHCHLQPLTTVVLQFASSLHLLSMHVTKRCHSLTANYIHVKRVSLVSSQLWALNHPSPNAGSPGRAGFAGTPGPPGATGPPGPAGKNGQGYHACISWANTIISALLNSYLVQEVRISKILILEFHLLSSTQLLMNT